jgi:ABC-type glycerol-3-phosphate transport system substrate-binding protein
MAIHWSWSAFEVDDPTKSITVGLWDFAPVPKEKYSVPHLAAWPIVIPKTSDNPEEAFKFIAWLENAENDVRQAHMGGGDPVRAASYSDPRLTDQNIPGTNILKFRRYKALEEAMKTTKVRPFFPQEETWELTVSPYLSAVQIGDMTVEEALEEANEAVEKMLKK